MAEGRISPNLVSLQNLFSIVMISRASLAKIKRFGMRLVQQRQQRDSNQLTFQEQSSQNQMNVDAKIIKKSIKGILNGIDQCLNILSKVQMSQWSLQKALALREVMSQVVSDIKDLKLSQIKLTEFQKLTHNQYYTKQLRNMIKSIFLIFVSFQITNQQLRVQLSNMRLINKQMRIAIIGAGIGGISLAISLKMNGFNNISLFQKDKSLAARRQGYGLTILQAKKALKQLGVLEQAKKLNSPSKVHYIFDHRGQILGFYGTLFWDGFNQQRSQKSKEKGLSMHIPRQQIRTLLYNRLIQVNSTQDCINWDMKLQKIDPKEKSIELKFENGVKVESELVIGCDGIFSSLRQLSTLQDENLNYLNVVIALGLCNSTHSLTKERVFQSGNGKARLFCMPFLKNSPHHSTMWQLSMPLDFQKTISLSKDPSEAKQFFLNLCKDWHEPIPSLIKNTKLDDLMTIAAYDRNMSPFKLTDDRIFLLGDSMHPMSPFKGQGANQALLDAVCLGKLMSECQNLKELDQKYRKQVTQRVENKVVQSRRRVEKYHNSKFTQIQSYLYPRIDQRLIKILRENNINSQYGQQIQSKILELMQNHHYFQ